MREKCRVHLEGGETRGGGGWDKQEVQVEEPDRRVWNSDGR